ncbi:MAG: homoserine dehydrogenase, partial [Reinekea sp.]|nr:homoserine dehydrogenase [Reinekea sp.]
MKPVNVGICGLGTVGAGTFNVLQRNLDDIARRAGRPVRITHVGARRDNPACDLTGVKVSRDIFDVVRDPEVHIVVELIGGLTVAKDLVLAAIEQGKDVVTANKALIAEFGNEIFEAAEKNDVVVAYEASVAGGIPIIKAIREGLVANHISGVAGIINGTGNFILTEMRDKGRAFEDVLAEAQALGYAEA